MTPILFYDSETTGLPLYGSRSSDPDQPHLVQLAALLVDEDTQKILQSIDLIIRPDGWVIPPEMTAIHGITHEHAMAVGVAEADAVSIFWQVWGGRPRVAHNEGFDARIIRIALMRLFPEATTLPEEWKAGEARCTLGMVRKDSEYPKGVRHTMEAAYQHYVKKELQDAHTALADAKACMEVYFAAPRPS